MGGGDKMEKICPECGSDKIVKHGIRITRKGNKQKYKCKNCAHIFTKKEL